MNERDFLGRTPLMGSALRVQAGTLKLLLDNPHTQVNLVDDSECSALNLLIWKGRYVSAEILSLIVRS